MNLPKISATAPNFYTSLSSSSSIIFDSRQILDMNTISARFFGYIPAYVGIIQRWHPTSNKLCCRPSNHTHARRRRGFSFATAIAINHQPRSPWGLLVRASLVIALIIAHRTSLGSAPRSLPRQDCLWEHRSWSSHSSAPCLLPARTACESTARDRRGCTSSLVAGQLPSPAKYRILLDTCENSIWFIQSHQILILIPCVMVGSWRDH